MSKIAVIGMAAYAVKINAEPVEGYSVASGFKAFAGGDGLLISTALAELGNEVSFLAAVGSDEYAGICLDALEKSSVDSNLIVKNDCATPVINTVYGTRRSSVLVPGAYLKPLDLNVFEQAVNTSELVVICSDTPVNVCDAILRMTRKNGKKTVYVLTGFEKPEKAFLASVTVALGADKMRAYLSPQFCRSSASLREGCGVSWREGKDAFFAPSVQGSFDMYFAFDSFCAGVCSKLASGASLHESAFFARACAYFASTAGDKRFPNAKQAESVAATLKK